MKRYYVPLNLADKGMILDENIMDRMDRVLIARGTVLNDRQIRNIKNLGKTGIYICEEGEEEEDDVLPEDLKPTQISDDAKKTIEQMRTDDPQKVHLSESVKKSVSEGISYLYNNSDAANFTETSTKITSTLVDAIESNHAIAVDISILKTSDEYTFRHSVDVATISMIIAKKQGFPREDIYNIGIAGLLHDMGKAKIPPEILNKPARLTDEEFKVMKRHSELGYRILRDKKGISEQIATAVLQHHEKSNGRGYPLGIRHDRIIPYARILSVADVYDALVTQRPYKKPMSQRNAVELMMSMTEELDIEAMQSFLHSVVLYPVDTIVSLSNGERARVVNCNTGAVLRPVVVGLKSGRVYNLADDLNCANIVIK